MYDKYKNMADDALEALKKGDLDGALCIYEEIELAHNQAKLRAAKLNNNNSSLPTGDEAEALCEISKTREALERLEPLAEALKNLNKQDRPKRSAHTYDLGL